jgi:hypothetical protein
MSFQWLKNAFWQHRNSILSTFAIPDDYLALFEIDILYP